MKKSNLRLLIALVFFVVSHGISAKTEIKNLVTEYLTNPVGIDIIKPRLSWQLFSTETNVMQSAYEIRMASSSNNLIKGKDLIWSSGKILSDQSVNIEYNGPELQSKQRVYWQVRIWDQKGKVSKWSQPAFWEMGLLQTTDWKAKWISANEDKTDSPLPCPYFRKQFSTAKTIQSARIYVTSLGLYQLFLNGEKVSNDLFSPGWTSYNKRLQYQTYDVTSLLKNENAIGAILGDGWYRGRIGWARNKNYYGNKLALLLQLEIKYSDGSAETIISDENWKTSTGPILASGIYDGETYDARLEKKGWSTSTFDDNQWNSVIILDHSKDMLVASQSNPVQGTIEIKPIAIITTPKGETVLDMGQNMTGWLRMKVKGEQGNKVSLSFGEVLDKEGNFYRDNMRSAKTTDTYILQGDEEETFEPHFTFHGFRFVKLIDYPGTPQLDDFTGVVIHSDMQPTGSFSCSDSLINQLQHNIQWGQRGNFLDIPTDCPQRDERLGWTGDAQVFSMTAAYNFNVAPFFTKWSKDIAADQHPDGKIPHVIPDVMLGREGGSTAWADASVIIPWTVYQVYGDKRILEDQYESMKAWVEFMKSQSNDDSLWTKGFHFGDWLAFATTWSDYPGATTEKDLIANAYFYYSTQLLSKAAKVIGKTDDVQKYEALCNKIKEAFNKEYVTPNGRLVSHTQTAYVLALAFGLLPDELQTKATEYFANDVRRFGHLTTGFVGTPLLCHTLSATGHDDLAFMLLTRKDYPSWLYPVTQGATTIWERWDGQKPDGSFQDVGMNSFNHYAYGAIGEWLYSYVAGLQIDPENAGYKHFNLCPHIGGGLTNAKAEFHSMYGTILSAWTKEGETFIYNIKIPANTTATIELPLAKANKVVMNNKELIQSKNNGLKEDTDKVIVNLGSGNYTFKYPIKAVK
ncbi:family 78 glycoside hydrolase catalytic domain [Carboxylicivirga caseinilyticus]|uniref:alpha-L-rhamnosidase n=1 Tax=Carboxylicivirga caseinilyticus TaxID=3417572 RepID=UPI003D324C0E|nr:family 78 glycoside hydrolase catalytic domain [Marinilabiliaceae bacterium A049]